MRGGYEGVRGIEKQLTNTVGWSATSGQVGELGLRGFVTFIEHAL
uniref:Uncharacterized protein n=1 Tax=Arundo donax TaxID=35708 RepID=A0A0A9Q485_ARUDO